MNLRSSWLVTFVLCVAVSSAARAQSCPDVFDTGSLSRLAHRTPSIEAAPSLALRGLIENTLLSYACQEFVNHYARRIGARDDTIVNQTDTDESSNTISLRSAIHGPICGSIRLEVPSQRTVGADPKISTAYLEISKSARGLFMKSMADLNVAAQNHAQFYVAHGLSLPKPSRQVIDLIGREYIDLLAAEFQTLVSREFIDLTAQNEFLARTHCKPLLPAATGPDVELLRASYERAADHLEQYRTDIGMK